MEAKVTTKGKEKLLKARAGAITLPKIVGFAFGEGGASRRHGKTRWRVPG